MTLFPQRRDIQANFDWVDLVSATGFIVFDGLNARDLSGNNYTLMDSTFSSALVGTSVLDATVAPQFTTFGVTGDDVQYNKDLDIDFDTSVFQLPRTIEGTAIMRATIGGDSAGGTDFDNVYIIAKLRKWDSSSETEIASVTSTTNSSLVASEELSRTLVLTVPRTLIEKGEQIRLTIEVWTRDTAGGNFMRLCHDPNDASISDAIGGAGAISTGNSRLAIAIPFKLDFL